MLAGDATAPDPVCDKSPAHQVVLDAVARAQQPGAVSTAPLVFRDPKASRRIAP